MMRSERAVRAATYNSQLKRAQELLVEAGVTRRGRKPPRVDIVRSLLHLPPPLFSSFPLNAVVMGAEFGVLWGLGMWLCLWAWQGLPAVAMLLGPAVAGVGFGVAIAAWARKYARKLGLPRWEDLARPPEPDGPN